MPPKKSIWFDNLLWIVAPEVPLSRELLKGPKAWTWSSAHGRVAGFGGFAEVPVSLL